jgi:hypothetical protein
VGWETGSPWLLIRRNNGKSVVGCSGSRERCIYNFGLVYLDQKGDVMNTYTLINQDREYMVRRYKWAVKHGVVFNGLPASDDLASINGVHIMFFVRKDTPRSVIEEAKKDAKRKRDVVGFSCLVVPKEFPDDDSAQSL